jgi:hypothetical protein
MKGYAPGWQVRCLTCGLRIDAGEAGVVRVGAVGKTYTLGRCSRCQRLRCLVVERKKERAAGTEGEPKSSPETETHED